MALSTPAFFLFFSFTWLVFWLGGRVRGLRLSVLLAANCFFLAKFNLAFLLLLPVAASVDYFVGRGLTRSGTRQGRGAWLGLSLLVNVGLLVATKVLPLTSAAARVAPWLTLSLSFYCFQSLTYTIDLFRREEEAEPAPSWLAYLSAALFFPTLIAGPILRLPAFLKQLLLPPRLTAARAGHGFLLIATGLVKKLLIADFLAENLVVRVFDTPTLYSGAEVLAGVYGYAFQLFFDFSGYTDIVRGCGLLLGLELPENFNRPYLAMNLMDFWRRWHITFSFWLRDYVQERLPQRRRNWPLLSYSYSVILTMLLGGLWHGSGWTFLVWGALHGVALAAVRLWKNARRKRKPARSGAIAATVVTFHFVCFTWIFFNAASLANAGDVLGRLATLGTRAGWSHENLTGPVMGVLLIAVVAHCLPATWFDWGATVAGRAPFWVQGTALAGVVLGIQALAGRGAPTFIYGNF